MSAGPCFISLGESHPRHPSRRAPQESNPGEPSRRATQESKIIKLKSKSYEKKLGLYKRNGDLSWKYCSNHWFYNFSENRIAVAAARVCEGPPFPNQNYFSFRKCCKTNYFNDILRVRWGQQSETCLIHAPNPISANLVWGIMKGTNKTNKTHPVV